VSDVFVSVLTSFPKWKLQNPLPFVEQVIASISFFLHFFFLFSFSICLFFIFYFDKIINNIYFKYPSFALAPASQNSCPIAAAEKFETARERVGFGRMRGVNLCQQSFEP